MRQLKRSLPTVVLSIETATREMDSKLVLAAALAARGYRGIVAHKEVAKEIARASSRIAWLGKSVFSRSDRSGSVAHDLHRKGSPLLFHHDEGGIYPERIWETCLLRSHPPEFLSEGRFARVCTWGEKQRRVLTERVPALDGKVVSTGSSRFDICGNEYGWIDESYPSHDRRNRMPYILVNTRFPTVVHAENPTFGFEREMRAEAWPDWMTIDEVQDQFLSVWSQDAQDLGRFLRMLVELARAQPDHTIVVRPHPSESIEFYEVALRHVPNAAVIREGSVVPWIRDAALVVHCKCTTGVEAVFAGKPVVQYWPEPGRDLGGGETVAREAGVTVSTIPEVLDAVDGLLRGERREQAWSADAIDMLANLEQPAVGPLVDEVVSVFSEWGIDASEVLVPEVASKGWLGRFFPSRSRGEVGYVERKRGRMTRDRLEAIVGGCDAIFPGVTLRDSSDQYAVVEPA